MARLNVPELVDHLEQTASAVGEALQRRYGPRIADGLARAGVLSERGQAYLRDAATETEQRLDALVTVALFHDCLSAILLPCLRSQAEWSAAALDEARPFLQRVAGFFASLQPRYAAFRSLPPEKVADFLDLVCSDREGVIPGASWAECPFLGLKLCAHVSPCPGRPHLIDAYRSVVLVPLWGSVVARLPFPPREASEVWADIEALAEPRRGT